MKKYIHAYIVGGQTLYTALQSWSTDDLNGNDPLKITFNDSESGYENISSIQNWEKYASNFKERYQQIKTLFEENEWQYLSTSEKEIVAKYFLVEKALRDEVLTEEEQTDYNYFKLYNYLSDDVIYTKGISNLFITPKSIDYKQEIDGRFYPKYTFDDNGWLVECEYFSELEISQDAQGFTQYNYSNPILKYEASYTMKPDGYVGSRTVTRRWYRLDGTLDADAKITEKFYEPMNARDEGKKRRRNIVNSLMIETIGLFIMTSPDLPDIPTTETDAMPFLKEISSGLSDYYEYGSKEDSLGNNFLLKQQILDSTYPRLDNFVPETNDTVTIRDYLITKLSV